MSSMGLLSSIVHSILSIVSPASSIHAPPLPPLPPLLSPPPPPPPPPPRLDSLSAPSSSDNHTLGSISSLSTTIGQVATNLSLALKNVFSKSPPSRKLFFHELIASSPFPSPSSPSPGSSSKSVVIGVAIGVVVLLLAMLLLGYFAFKRKKNHDSEPACTRIPGEPNRSPPPYRYSDPPALCSNGGFNSGASDLPPAPEGIYVGSSQSLTYDEVAQATGWFAESNFLGEGGFGSVYRGVLGDGREVAVKRLKRDSRQGQREFQAEVEIISRVHHRHLVSLVGWCITAGEKILVYEFVPNKTLEFHLSQKGGASLDWRTRSRIALGAAKGLAYLHEDCQPKIIHRDIKAANILLDHQFEAKVADFGMAKFFADTNTHISTRVIGTFGYLAPEYAATGKVTDRSDVFSFGVVLLELITGKRPILQYGMEESLVDWAKPLLSRALDDGKYDGLVDPKVSDEYDHKEIGRMVACAAACIRHSAKRRPRMSQIVRALEGGFSAENLFDGGDRPGHSAQYGYMTEMRRLMTSLTSEQGSGSEQSSGSTGDLFSSPPTGSGTGSRSQPSETCDMDSSRLMVNDSK